MLKFAVWIVITHLCCMFVCSSSKSGFIDHHLKDLFKRLLTQTSDAYRIIQALGIEKGAHHSLIHVYCEYFKGFCLSFTQYLITK